MLVKISVRNLIEFVERSGDIDNRFKDKTRMIEGVRAHQKIQKSYGNNYTSEYFLKNLTTIKSIDFKVEGRADGIIKDGDTYIVDEIKSTSKSLDDIDGKNNLHWAQAKCYAYFFALDNKLDNISIILTYVETSEYKIKTFRKEFETIVLKEFYHGLLEKYLDLSMILNNNIKLRDDSSKKIDFPFASYRMGQRQMSLAIYKSILDKKNLLIDAPTGIGKTISSLFPAIKSLGEGLTDKIFYLTSKQTTGKSALDTIKMLEAKGLVIKTLEITSKEKICLNDMVKCNPVDCPYAKGHYDRVNDALKDILSAKTTFDFETIRSYAEKYRVCPLEFELDLATYSDLIICDYNYIFDPNVYLRRFFDENPQRFVFLIDEAHNLLERARDMYSISLRKSSFMEISAILYKKLDKKIINKLDIIIQYFDTLANTYLKTDKYYSKDHLNKIDDYLKNLSDSLEVYLIKRQDEKDYDKVLDLYFLIYRYLRISDEFRTGFYNVISKDKADLIFEIICIDPSSVLKNKYDYSISTIFFSATLSPIGFFKKMLGAKDSKKLSLDSPFNPDKLLILSKNISTRYKDRSSNIGIISECIHEFINSKRGNYFIFFPSFTYLEEVYKYYNDNYDDEIISQERIMDPIKRSRFLKKFNKDRALTGFIVLGGVFSEGIDLIGDRLIGSMIISVGMPGVSFERNLIKEHFDKENLSGFDYSYTYPGINKVLQAVGRVIRTDTDKGVIYLLDDRYNSFKYRNLFPKHWKDITIINNSEDFNNKINDFWSNDEKKQEL